MRRNKNVSILVDVDVPQIRGVLIYGAAETAELGSESEVEAMALSICEKYVPKEKIKDQWRVVCPPTTSRLKVTVKPKRMASFDYSG